MKSTAHSLRQAEVRHRSCSHRLRLEVLEDRLPPGDWLLGAMFGSSLLGTGLVIGDATLRASGVAGTEALSANQQKTYQARLSTLEMDRSSAQLPAPLSFRAEQTESHADSSHNLIRQEFAENDTSDLVAGVTPGLLGADELLASAVFNDPVQGLGTPQHTQVPKAHGHGTDAAGGTFLAVAGGGVTPLVAPGYGSGSGLGVTQTLAATASYSGPSSPDPSPLVAHVYRALGPGVSPEANSGPLGDILRQSSTVHARFDLSTPTSGAFPSNWFTVADDTQNTGRRVNMPLPDSATHPSDYQDTLVLNTLDGFNLQPRLSIPFDGPIDVSTVSSRTMFLIGLGDTLNPTQHHGEVVGINQVVWDVATTTLHAESDALLAQHTRYALIVTNGIHDTTGSPVEASPVFRHVQQTAVHLEYKDELLDAIHAASDVGVPEQDIVTASAFTTESATAVLEKVRDQIHAATPQPADFNLGPNGTRTVFSLDQVRGINWNQQIGSEPARFSSVGLHVSLLRLIPGAVGQVAFGKYLSPDYEVHPGEYIPPVGTLSGAPIVQGVNEVFFNLFLPSGAKPVGGWPVAIFGHGQNGSKNDDPPYVAAMMAAHGIATVTINAVGHGFGPLGTLTVNQTVGGPMTFSAGGRGIDQNLDHVINGDEGLSAAPPQTIILDRDGKRQTVVDLMQLVRVIEVGMDVDGDGSRALDPSRIYYFGQSLGGIYGTDFLAIEPSVRAGVPNVPGGPLVEYRRLSPLNRARAGSYLASRIPSLINSPGITQIGGVSVSGPFFNENMPLRDGIPLHVRLVGGASRDIQSPVINDVAGAMAIQEVFDNVEWVSQSGDPVAYGPHLRKDPLAGVPAKLVIFQFAKGDQRVPNPTATAILRAGDLADRATFYRHDLAFADNPNLPKNPHVFLDDLEDPNFKAIGLGAQEQIAAFFASDGTDVIHPKPAKYFEVPIQGPLPENLNYIP